MEPMPKMEPVAGNKLKVTDDKKDNQVSFKGQNFDITFSTDDRFPHSLPGRRT